MVELIATAIITVSSVLLFGYWLRCAFLLLRGQYPPPEAALPSTVPSFSTPAQEDALVNRIPRIQSDAGIS